MENNTKDLSDGELAINNFPKSEKDRGFKIEPREHARSWLAFVLLATIIVLSIGIATATIFGYIDSTVAKDLATTLIVPITAIFGTVIGFYFGSSNS